MAQTSCVLIVPVALRDKANALGEAMGWGKGSYTVPLSADGRDPATHYGLRAWVSDTFVAMLSDAVKGTMPAPLAAARFPSADFAAIAKDITVSMQADMPGHFDSVIAGLGLKRVAWR